MAVNYTTKYSEKIAERFKIGSVTDSACGHDYSFVGAKTIKVYSVDTVTLNDFQRDAASNRFGAVANLGDTVQEMTMSQDKAFTFAIDAGDMSDQAIQKSAGKALRREIDEVVNPTMDKYRLNAWATHAGLTHEVTANPNKSTIVEAILEANAKMTDALVPVEGRTESSGDPILNAANNFLNPAYTSQVDVDAVEEELQKVRDMTGDTAVFPTAAQRYIEVDGTRKDLTADEYEQYARKLGTERYSLLQDAMASSAYKGMSYQEKADYISDLYSYAGAVAKADVSSYQLDGWQKNASTAQQDIGVSPAEYIALYQKYGSSVMSSKAYEKAKEAVSAGLTVEEYANMKASLDANGNGSVSQAEAKSALDSQDFSKDQKADLWNIINSSWKTNPYR